MERTGRAQCHWRSNDMKSCVSKCGIDGVKRRAENRPWGSLVGRQQQLYTVGNLNEVRGVQDMSNTESTARRRQEELVIYCVKGCRKIQ